MSSGLFSWEFFGFGDNATKKKLEHRTVLPMDTTHEKVAARSHLNSIREAMGLNILRQNNQLNIAAQAHADYLVANNESSHFEIEGHHKFVEVKPVDRTLYADYSSTYVSENLSTHIYSGQESINSLFSIREKEFTK